MTWLSTPPPASAASPDPWYPPWVLFLAVLALIVLAVAGAARRWSR